MEIQLSAARGPRAPARPPEPGSGTNWPLPYRSTKRGPRPHCRSSAARRSGGVNCSGPALVAGEELVCRVHSRPHFAPLNRVLPSHNGRLAHGPRQDGPSREGGCRHDTWATLQLPWKCDPLPMHQRKTRIGGRLQRRSALANCSMGGRKSLRPARIVVAFQRASRNAPAQCGRDPGAVGAAAGGRSPSGASRWFLGRPPATPAAIHEVPMALRGTVSSFCQAECSPALQSTRICPRRATAGMGSHSSQGLSPRSGMYSGESGRSRRDWSRPQAVYAGQFGFVFGPGGPDSSAP